MNEPRTIVCPDCKGTGSIGTDEKGCCKQKVQRKCLRCKGVGRIPK